MILLKSQKRAVIPTLRWLRPHIATGTSLWRELRLITEDAVRFGIIRKGGERYDELQARRNLLRWINVQAKAAHPLPGSDVGRI